MERTTLHIVGGESRSRAEQARIAFALGHHAEVYADLEELFDRPPGHGIVIAADDGAAATTAFMDRSAREGVWLPLVVASQEPKIEQIVAAVKAGALDYLKLPLEMSTFARRLAGIAVDARAYIARRRSEVLARCALAALSPRELEVLGLLSAGCSNKEIARNLDISPRTVEIHRGNMMTKLGARHVAHAVRLWVDGQDKQARPPEEMPDTAPPAASLDDWRVPPPAGMLPLRRQRQ